MYVHRKSTVAPTSSASESSFQGGAFVAVSATSGDVNKNAFQSKVATHVYSTPHLKSHHELIFTFI